MIILIGEGGCGKTTILNELEKRGYTKAINHTTRPKRESEETLKEYVFLSKEEFEQMWNEGKLLQRAEFGGEHYGISVASLADNVACIQIVKSIEDVKQRAKELGREDAKIVSFYVYVSPEERTKRMLARGDNINNIQKRIEVDNGKFKEAKDIVDYVVENKKDELEQTVDKIIELYTCQTI